MTTTATASTMPAPTTPPRLTSHPATPTPSAPLHRVRSGSMSPSSQPKKQARNSAPANASPVRSGRKTGVFWRSRSHPHANRHATTRSVGKPRNSATSAFAMSAPTGPRRLSTRLSPGSKIASRSAPSRSASSVGACVTTASATSTASAIRMMPSTSCLRWREKPPADFFFLARPVFERAELRVLLTGVGGRTVAWGEGTPKAVSRCGPVGQWKISGSGSRAGRGGVDNSGTTRPPRPGATPPRPAPH